MMDALTSKNLFFRTLTIEDASSKYVNWLNDKTINKYLEVRHDIHTKKSVQDFIASRNKSDCEFLYGIFFQENKKHIGNVKIGNVNNLYKTGEISLFIGDKNYWGKGLGVEVIKSITIHGFSEIGLKKIEAGCYESNIASLKSFLASGYVVEGKLKSHVVLDGNREDLIRLGILQNAKIS